MNLLLTCFYLLNDVHSTNKLIKKVHIYGRFSGNTCGYYNRRLFSICAHSEVSERIVDIFILAYLWLL